MKRSDLLREQETPMVLGIELDRQTLTPVRRPIRPVVQPTYSVFVPCPELPPDPNPSCGLLGDLRALSSGTLASLTGETSYDAIDRIQTALVLHYLQNYNPRWRNWVNVWTDYLTSQAAAV